MQRALTPASMRTCSSSSRGTRASIRYRYLQFMPPGTSGTRSWEGVPGRLPRQRLAMMQATLRALARHCPGNYRVSYEITHHGPTGLTHPSFFVEIGSTEKEWADPAAGRAVAEAVLEAEPLTNAVPLIGFGGTHYAVRETGISLATRGAFGHIAHTREIASLDEDMCRSMIERSGAVAAYIDRKALDHACLGQLTGLLDHLGVPGFLRAKLPHSGNCHGKPTVRCGIWP